ncbi:MAG: carboxypeptidase-like regulatory domain-containing protein, partial [Acidobacteriaceae bacterium]|nr:carboxypeptidase-like regulatory domain-containing protein [Acidobacteriaceae bacterium]
MLPTVVLAQRYLGALSGAVNDATGAKVVGAKVTAVAAATKFTTSVTTGADGNWLIPSLQPDTYTITVAAEGFKKEVRTGVVVSAGQNIQADVVLAAGAVTETVEVSTVS